MNRSFKHGLAVICALFMCTACGQAEPPAASETSAETTTTAAETTTTAKNEEETTTTKTETEAVTEETTEATKAATEANNVDIPDTLLREISIDEDSYGVVPNEVIIATAVLNYYGISCDTNSVNQYYSDGDEKSGETFENTINGYLSSQGITNLVVNKVEKSDLDDAKVVKEIANDHLVVYWNFKFERCATIGG